MVLYIAGSDIYIYTYIYFALAYEVVTRVHYVGRCDRSVRVFEYDDGDG